MEKKKFEEYAENTTGALRERGRYGSSSDLYLEKNGRFAVIGIQTSGLGRGRDSIYVLRNDEAVSLEMVVDDNWRSGRTFPTGILEDACGFSYTQIDDSGKRQEKIYKI